MTTERLALQILLKVTQEGAFANLALKEALSDERPKDVGRLTALVYTTIEHLNYCDHIIDSYAKGRLHGSVRGILRLAVAEMFFMDTPDHAVCNKAVKLTESIGKGKLKGFVNGVLRNIARDRASGDLPKLPESFPERMRILSGYPEFMVEEYTEDYGEGFAEELMLAAVRGVALRAVPPLTADELASHLDGLGIPYRRSELADDCVVALNFKGDITKDELFIKGLAAVQSESAMLACRCLDPKPGMNVLDACAAPGGKTAYLSDLMKRQGRITAWDVHPHRVELIKNTLERLGVRNALLETRDASKKDESLCDSFDAILLDVPCSGLGGGSKPDARLRRTNESIDELANIQYSILETCSAYLKKGGALVYSTCTLSDREDEHVVERFLNEHNEFGLESLADLLPDKLKQRGEKGMLRLFPNVDDTEGFFIAKLRRK
ncbi:MAG: 16S rRNA (cytosine(967)-C(5))-methyltransferase RsmB [Clostridiales bacterium]|nr:16S rRNA (cytosine(967)-C(5))-methyltransferase RsmB [Clostridiales bacterium]